MRRPSAESLESTQVDISLFVVSASFIFSKNCSRIIASLFVRENDPGWGCWPWRVHYVQGMKLTMEANLTIKIIEHNLISRMTSLELTSRLSALRLVFLLSEREGWRWRFSLLTTFTFNLLLLQVTQEDFKKSKENVLYRKQEGTPEGLYM